MHRLHLSGWFVFALTATVQAQDMVKAHDDRLTITKFAAAPDIVQPIAIDFDQQGRLLVVESHTHFRPANYNGPKFDRIRLIEDTNSDGKADKFTTFFEGTTATMDLAVHPDGSVYVATRNEVLRLRDTNNDGVADENVRLVFLDTKGNYPHNGLSGLSFDFHGDLIFGMGENLGESYKLVGKDGTTLSGGGEGGNVYHITADGAKLRRVATGFWNPFGACHDIFGRVFVVDNDPDSSPPCRLLQLVDQADYGFQFRYGRAGRHPFQAWNGELAGTLPMVAGTGESPCEVVSYESDGLPAEYHGQLLVPAWADHRIERYVLKPNGAGFTAERKPFITGGREFRPSGLAVAPNGSLYITDWVSQSYPLHGKGAIWQVRWKDHKPKDRPTESTQAILSDHRPTRDAAAKKLANSADGKTTLRKLLASDNPRTRATALSALLDVKDDQLDLLSIARNDQEIGIREMAVRALVDRKADVGEFAKAEVPAPLRAMSLATLPDADVLKLTADADPYLRHAAIVALAKRAPTLLKWDVKTLTDGKQRAGLLLALRASGHADASSRLPEWLVDTDPVVRLLAAKWVSDEQLKTYRPLVAEMLASPSLDSRGLIGFATTLARLDNKPVNDDALAGYFVERLNDTKSPTAQRVQALRAIPSASKRLSTESVLKLLAEIDDTLKIEAMRLLKDRGDTKALAAVRELANDVKQTDNVRAQALVTWVALGEPDVTTLLDWSTGPAVLLSAESLRALAQTKLTADQSLLLEKVFPNNKNRAALVKRIMGKPLTTERPTAKDVDGWLKHLEGPADIDAGRRVFEHTKVAGCAKCHRVDGRGGDAGPDLSLIGRTERRWIVESLLQPSASVAPHFQTWRIETKDGRTRTGLLVRTNLDESEYVDPQGNRFKVLAGEIEQQTAVRESIMPEGLLDGLTDQEIRNLVAYLESKK